MESCGSKVDSLEQHQQLRALLETNPIPAWTGGKGTGGTAYFAYADATLSTTVADGASESAELCELTQELVDWRLGQYLARGVEGAPATHFVCNVSHAGGGNPMLFLPKGTINLPVGKTRVLVDGEALEADFVKVALNVVHREGSSQNLLPDILRRWFGPKAGEPGQGPDRVRFEWRDDGYAVEPIGREERQGPVLWQEYEREQTTPLWGLPFPGHLKQQGFGRIGKQIFLLVTLEKKDLPADHRYADRFLSPDRFQWQSQNRTKRASPVGQDIAHHRERGLEVQLFIRRSPKTQRGTATPFTYCGPVDFVRWEGDNPITVEWQLRTAVPANLRRGLGVPG